MASAVVSPPPKPRPVSRGVERIPPLENGAHLSGREFLRRYEAMPEVKKAELINGIVVMGSPVRIDQHGEPDGLLQVWLGNYAISTLGVKHAINSTARLDPDNHPQPDGLLRLLPRCGGRARIDLKGYLEGPPDLAAEVAASSASIDLHEKLASYRRAGVREYLVWRTEDAAVDWWTLEQDEYQPISPDAEGLLRSRIFPGLWLSVPALIAEDGPKLLAQLQQGLNSAEHAEFVASLLRQLQSSVP